MRVIGLEERLGAGADLDGARTADAVVVGELAVRPFVAVPDAGLLEEDFEITDGINPDLEAEVLSTILLQASRAKIDVEGLQNLKDCRQGRVAIGR